MMKLFFTRLCCVCFTTLPFLASAQAAQWPPATDSKVPLNAMEYPTTLAPQQTSMTQLIRSGAQIISAGQSDKGPFFTLKKGKRYLFCMLTGPVPNSDQQVATSRCYGLNP